jgi:hypothetical protein
MNQLPAILVVVCLGFQAAPVWPAVVARLRALGRVARPD